MIDTNHAQSIERRVIAKLSWRILPLIFLSDMIAVMDRANISYASDLMITDPAGGDGQPFTEIALFTVRGGQIAEERYFYA